MGIRDELLKKCTYADLSNFNFTTNTYLIPKYTKGTYELGKCYLIKVNDELINNNSSVEAINWNNGLSPKFPYLKIYVSKIIDKMLYVDAAYYDYTKQQDLPGMFSGYLPINKITQLSKI